MAFPSSPYNRRHRFSDFVVIGGLPNNRCRTNLRKWLEQFGYRDFNVSKIILVNRSWSARVYGALKTLNQFVAAHTAQPPTFFGSHCTVSEPQNNRSQNRNWRHKDAPSDSTPSISDDSESLDSHIACWKFMGESGCFHPYDPRTSARIESLAPGDTLKRVRIGSFVYCIQRVNLTHGIQIHINSGQQRAIIREDKKDMSPPNHFGTQLRDEEIIQNLLCLDADHPEQLPKYWSSLVVNDSEDQKSTAQLPRVRLIEVPPTSEQSPAQIIADRVRQQFHKSLPRTAYDIVSIKLCENMAAFQHYQYFRKVRAEHAVANLNERFLFHGTHSENIDGILSDGFLRDFGRAEAYGHGCYFGVEASCSVSYAPPDARGIQRMLWCIVVCGDSIVNQPGAKRPPRKANGFEYETMVPSLDGVTGIFVVPNDYQAYPLAVIEFRSRIDRSNSIRSFPIPMMMSPAPQMAMTPRNLLTPKPLGLPMQYAMNWAPPPIMIGGIPPHFNLSPMFSVAQPLMPGVGSGALVGRPQVQTNPW